LPTPSKSKAGPTLRGSWGKHSSEMEMLAISYHPVLLPRLLDHSFMKNLKQKHLYQFISIIKLFHTKGKF